MIVSCDGRRNTGSARADLLLLNPPFARTEEPMIAIPTLASYLDSKGIALSVFDVNREFFRRFLTPSTILEGKAYAVERFHSLNNQRTLDFMQVVEYMRLLRINILAGMHRKEMEALSSGSFDPGDLQRSPEPLKTLLIQMAAAPFFSDSLFNIQHPVFNFSSRFHQYASRDIIESAGTDTLYSGIVDDISRELIESESPKVVGLSVSYYNQILPAFRCAAAFKKAAPSIHIVMGGSSIFTFFRDVANKELFSLVDSFVMDDGELPLEILTRELTGKSPDLRRVPGLIYLEDGEIRRNPSAGSPPLETLPPPDYNVFELDGYLGPKEELFIPFRTSKGCYWGRCSFCRTKLPTLSRWQELPMDHVLAQLKEVIRDAGCNKIHLADESIGPEFLELLSMRILEEKMDITWRVQTRVHKSLTKERCELYKRAGCVHLSLGVESFNDRILALMKKGINARLINEVITGMGGVLPLSIFMVLGFPTETEEEAIESHREARRLKELGLISDYVYSTFAIYSGSDIAENPGKYGIGGIRRPERCDLAADLTEFDCQGMSRARMRELYMQFTQEPKPPNRVFPKQVPIDGRTTSLNFDLSEMEAMVEKRIQSESISSYYEWLKSGTEKLQSMGCIG